LINQFKINGVSLREAVAQWWNDDVTTPASKHTYTPCK